MFNLSKRFDQITVLMNQIESNQPEKDFDSL